MKGGSAAEMQSIDNWVIRNLVPFEYTRLIEVSENISRVPSRVSPLV